MKLAIGKTYLQSGLPNASDRFAIRIVGYDEERRAYVGHAVGSILGEYAIPVNPDWYYQADGQMNNKDWAMLVFGPQYAHGIDLIEEAQENSYVPFEE